MDNFNGSDSRLAYRVASSSAPSADLVKDARIWLLRAPPTTQAQIEIIQEYVYKGGGAIVSAESTSWTAWAAVFGDSWPLIEPYNLPGNQQPFGTTWRNVFAGLGSASSPLENGLYGRVNVTQDYNTSFTSFVIAPFSVDEGALR